MKKINLFLIALISSFLLISCGGNDLKDFLGTWKCVDCGENIAEYSFKFESFGDCVMEGDGFRYLGTWEDPIGDLEEVKITLDGSFDRYYIKSLSSKKLVMELDGQEIIFEKVK